MSIQKRLKKAWNEFDKRLDGEKYECLIPKEIATACNRVKSR